MSTLTLTLSGSDSTYYVDDGTNTYSVSDISYEVSTNYYQFNIRDCSGSITDCSGSIPCVVSFDSSGVGYIFSFHPSSYELANYFTNKNNTIIYQTSTTDPVSINLENQFLYAGIDGSNVLVTDFTNTYVQDPLALPSWTFCSDASFNKNVNSMSYSSSDNTLTFYTYDALPNVAYENICIIGVMAGITFLQTGQPTDTTNSDLIAALLLIGYSYIKYSPY